MVFATIFLLNYTQNSSESVRSGEQIVNTYRRLLERPKSIPTVSKGIELGALLEHLENSQQDKAMQNPYMFIALRAIRAEWGRPADMSTKQVDNQVMALFPQMLQKYWSPETKRIWLQAFYVPGQRPIGEVRKQIAWLKANGANSEPLEALSAVDGVLNSKMSHAQMIDAIRATARRLLSLSESTPSDVTAVSRAIGVIDLAVIDDIVMKHPLGEKDIIDRIFALEPRTIRNFNRALHDDMTHLPAFDTLRRHLADIKG